MTPYPVRWGLALGFGLLVAGIGLSASRGWFPELFDQAARVPGGDFTAHAVLVGGLAVLMGWAVRPAGRTTWAWTMSAISLVAVVEEVSQIWQVRRTFSWGDLLANALGIGAAVLITRTPAVRNR